MNDIYPGLGHNAPVWIELTPEGEVKLSLELMREFLVDEVLAFKERADELLKNYAAVPAAFVDEDTANNATELVKMITTLGKAIQADREKRKAPFLEGGRVVDAVFSALRDPLMQAYETLRSRLTAFDAKREDERRRQLAAEAEAREAEAKRLAEQAESAAAAAATPSQGALASALTDAASTARIDADLAHEAVEATPAELSRRRGDFGAVASLRRYWDFRNIARGELDLESLRPYLPVDALEKAVRAFVKAGGRELKGVEIYEARRTQVR